MRLKTDCGALGFLGLCGAALALLALPVHAIPKGDQEACEGYRDLVLTIAQKADAGVSERQMKRLLAAPPDILPMVEIVYEQKARRSNSNIAAWHYAACMGDARKRLSGR